MSKFHCLIAIWCQINYIGFLSSIFNLQNDGYYYNTYLNELSWLFTIKNTCQKQGPPGGNRGGFQNREGSGGSGGGGGNYRGGETFTFSSLVFWGQAVGTGWWELLLCSLGPSHCLVSQPHWCLCPFAHGSALFVGLSLSDRTLSEESWDLSVDLTMANIRTAFCSKTSEETSLEQLICPWSQS